MTNSRAPRLELERVVKHVFGSTRAVVLFHGVGLLLMFGLATNALNDLLSQFVVWGDREPGGSWKVGLDAAAIVLFPLHLVWLWFRAGRNSPWNVPRVISDNRPTKLRGLVLFLSRPQNEKQVTFAHQLINSGEKVTVSDKDLLAKLGNWRMPLEAIGYHLPQLRHVVVLASDTLPEEPPARDPEGTAHQVTDFANLVHLFAGAESLRVESLSECLRGSAGKEAWVTQWRNGVNFEDVQQLLEAIEAAYQVLEARGLAAYEIGVDVTSGTKPTTIAGAIATLATGRHCQYVSTQTYRVMSFDVTYFD